MQSYLKRYPDAVCCEGVITYFFAKCTRIEINRKNYFENRTHVRKNNKTWKFCISVTPKIIETRLEPSCRKFYILRYSKTVKNTLTNFNPYKNEQIPRSSYRALQNFSLFLLYYTETNFCPSPLLSLLCRLSKQKYRNL